MHMLKRLGFSCVETVENGKEAVDFVAKSFQQSNNQQIHLILMDCQMPILDGYGATKIIREMELQRLQYEEIQSRDQSENHSNNNNNNTNNNNNDNSMNINNLHSKHIPIIALTANASDSDRQLCLLSGMDDFCTKPLTIERLDEIIFKWISHYW